MSVATSQPVPVSIICVFNDPNVRSHCLDRSIVLHGGEATVEYLTIDNVDGSFATAGAALNHGASLASNDVLVFAHQDVYLHSLRALETAARRIADDGRIGVLGAIGVDASGRMVGRVRDRVVLLGEPAREPTDVDSLDELLFMAPRRLVQSEPLSESPDLAWHAYAVEYGLRARSLGLRVCAVDIPLTHNSPTTNVDRLDIAYRTVAEFHPHALPVRTPGGIIASASETRPGDGVLSAHRWRYRWLRESVAAHLGCRASEGATCVLGDIRWDIDELISTDPNSSLLVINLDREANFMDEQPGPLELMRRAHPIEVTSEPMPRLIDRLATRDPGTSTLLTNLEFADLRALSSYPAEPRRLLGFRREIGYWMLLGPMATTVPQRWRSQRATPLGMSAPA